MIDFMLYGTVLIVLAALNAFQFVFFAREIQTLIDKLMSRDFADYDRVKRPKPKSTSPRIEPEFEEKPPEGFVF